MKIEITEQDRGWLADQMLEAIGRSDDDGESLHRMVEKAVESRLEHMVMTTFERALDREIGERVTSILEDGWPVTSSYGEHTGKTVTVRELILKKLDTPVGDSYDRTRKSLVAHLVAQAVEGALGKELKAELERAKAEIRAAVDGLIKEKLTETLRAALGIR
jgi:hypothetical protein